VTNEQIVEPNHYKLNHLTLLGCIDWPVISSNIYVWLCLAPIRKSWYSQVSLTTMFKCCCQNAYGMLGRFLRVFGLVGLMLHVCDPLQDSHSSQFLSNKDKTPGAGCIKLLITFLITIL
jgi:hypothetical protein